MRTNIVIDDKLMEDALRLSGAKSKREAVELGLRMLVQLRKQAEARGCRPIADSSRTNSVLTSAVTSAVVRLMRWTSPPDKVRLWRSSVR